MKKLLSLITVFLLLLNLSNGQVRLSEIVDRSGNNYIELYTSSTSSANKVDLAGYKILVCNGAGNTITKEISLAGLLGGPTAAERYFIIGPAASNLPVAGDFLGTQTESAIFLVKDGQVKDLFVAKDSYRNAVLKVNGMNSYTYTSGASTFTVDFATASVSPYNYSIIQALGSNASYSFIANNTTTSTCGSWAKSQLTGGSSNKENNGGPGSSLVDPEFQYFNSVVEFPSNGSYTSWTDITTTGNNTLPSPSFAISGSAVSRTINVRYTISQTNIPAVSGTTPSFEIWTDKNPDGVYDPILETSTLKDVALQTSEYTVSNMVTEGTGASTKYIFNVAIPVTSNLKNGGGFLNTLFFKLTSGGTASVPCYISITEMNFGEQALPVQLSKFTLKNAGLSNQLSWSTSSEQNNKGFEIQRSLGSTDDFRTIGFVGTKAKQGNSEAEISYGFEDTDVKAGQIHFYRLNQIDFDGKSAFSPVKSIKPGSIESNLNVYPNPSQGSFTVNTGSASGRLNIFVMDNTGRVVNQFMNVSTTNTRINNLEKGFYTLKIVNTESGEQSAQRVVVQ